MLSGNSLLSVPTFPKGSQLLGQDTWKLFKDQVKLTVQVRGLMGYLDGSIPKPTAATYLYTALSASSPDSQSPSPGEWTQRECMVASIIYLNCSDPIGIGIKREDIASKTWKYLVKKFNPDTTTMEEHKKKMKNLLKSLHNFGRTCNDYQFRMIIIASMPEAWKDYVLNVPGIFSSEAFTYLHWLYLDKVGHNQDTEDNLIQKKVGHIINKCWAKRGGAEGKAPKSWKDKYSPNGIKASSSDTFSPIDVYVGSFYSLKDMDNGSLMPF
ncbi:hypothetical protein BT96DRAFT_947768 [Gymnopus androsaceus JB14]|uniref:Uncharacterized protein n=1 Tax=Gymnopus androsaceus JB14 TaxID=1447944 RepID=A0A6A4GR69_9AGAR|nr:hypothetical protein BT96DRAFT_947768 [Gymnopus androsaceus JB14]